MELVKKSFPIPQKRSKKMELEHLDGAREKWWMPALPSSKNTHHLLNKLPPNGASAQKG